MSVSIGRLSLTSTYTPIDLFADGGTGVWFDFSDFSTMFQDASGTTPVTAVEQSVGLVLDKSKGLALGSELVTNGDFSGGSTGWTPGTGWSISGGVATYTAGTPAGLFQNASLSTNKRYAVTFTKTGTGSVSIRLGTGGTSQATYTTAGTYTAYVVPDGTSFIGFYGDNIGNFTIDNISIKEISGNHASQSVVGSRPVLSARYNLFSYSEQFDNATWTKNAVTVTADATTSPLGETTADKIIETATTAAHSVQANITSVVGYRYAFTVRAKAAERNRVQIQFLSGATNLYPIFSLVDGTKVVDGGIGNDWKVTSLGNGWWEFTIYGTAGNTTANYFIGPVATTTNNYAGDGTSGIYLAGADARYAEDGSTLPAYQKAVTATDYDSVGFSPYLKFDGVDDFLNTLNIDFSITDKVVVITGIRKLGDAAQGMVLELSTGITINTGGFTVVAPLTSPLGTVGFNARGTLSNTTAAYRTAAAPITAVLTGICDLAIQSRILRFNGSTAMAIYGIIGTGTFGNFPLYIGRRAGTSAPYSGRIYGIIIKAGMTEGDINAIYRIERWMINKTGTMLL